MADENENTDVEVWGTSTWEVYDPWTAQVRAVCMDKKDAKRVAKLFRRLKEKTGNNYA